MHDMLSPKVFTPEQLEARAQWKAALRSGKYPKGKGVLRDEDGGHCCLGVLEAERGGVFTPAYAPTTKESITVEGGDGSLYGIRLETARAVGLDIQDAVVCVKANDGWGWAQEDGFVVPPKSHPEIADMLDAQEQGVQL